MKLKKLIKNYLIKEKIEKIYKRTDFTKNIETKENRYPDKIWTMWIQGYDNAPPIIKACINSIKKYSEGRDVIVLDKSNINNFVDIPDFIEFKYNNGTIGHAHYSDYIRTCLLYHYGGTWMDATIFCTDNFDELLEEPFLILQNPITGGISNFFIHSNPQNIFMHYMLNFLTQYWKKEKKAFDYFFWHKTFIELVNTDETCKRIWANVPIYSNVNPHTLVKGVCKPCNQKWIKYVKRLTPIHKLTYKTQVKFNKADLSNIAEDSYWNEIVKEYI